MNWNIVLLQLVEITLPAYIANASPTFLIKLKKHPIDFGKKWGKQRILGDGKTIEGFAFASFAALLVGMIEIELFGPSLPLSIDAIGFMFIGMGAMIGDMTGSFIKRRLNMKRGENAGLLDMEDFIIGSLIAARLITPYSAWVAIIALAITPIIHRTANIIGYKIGVKREPW